VRRLLAALEGAPFSYPVPGATRGAAPSGYTVDHNRVRLGTGADAFRRAIEAVRRWAMFHLGWLELVPPAPALRVGTTVGVLVQHPGFWSLNPCRIVYLVDEEARFGFAYGTLPGHAEAGEERFTVEWNRADDSVAYDLLAFSRPHHILARAGYPFARLLQKRFARDSLRAMVAAVQ